MIRSAAETQFPLVRPTGRPQDVRVFLLPVAAVNCLLSEGSWGGLRRLPSGDVEYTWISLPALPWGRQTGKGA